MPDSTCTGMPYRYFDAAASCPPTDVCRDALARFDVQPWAGTNPNALHAWGRAAFSALEDARRSLARSLGAARPSEVVFTGGGTESNNIALRAVGWDVCARSHGARDTVVVSAFEHDSVLACAQVLEAWGLNVVLAPVTRAGIVDLAALGDILAAHAGRVGLVSVMAANNEVGTVQPVAEVAALAHAHGALCHTDAVQAFGHMPLDVRALGVDLASVTAHKLGGPVGVGALYVRSGVPDAPFSRPVSVGAGQERGIRPGTQDVRGACAFAAVAADAVAHLEERAGRLRALAQVLVDACCAGVGACARATVEGPRDARFLPGTVHLTVSGHQSEGLILGLDARGFAVAGGSACSSTSLEPSHVLAAMGVPRDEAFCALRLSFDDRTREQDVLDLAAALRDLASAAPARRRPARRG